MTWRQSSFSFLRFQIPFLHLFFILNDDDSHLMTPVFFLTIQYSRFRTSLFYFFLPANRLFGILRSCFAFRHDILILNGGIRFATGCSIVAVFRNIQVYQFVISVVKAQAIKYECALLTLVLSRL